MIENKIKKRRGKRGSCSWPSNRSLGSRMVACAIKEMLRYKKGSGAWIEPFDNSPHTLSHLLTHAQIEREREGDRRKEEGWSRAHLHIVAASLCRTKGGNLTLQPHKRRSQSPSRYCWHQPCHRRCWSLHHYCFASSCLSNLSQPWIVLDRLILL